MKRKTEKEKVEAAAVEMIETPLELIKAILMKHEAAMIEVMRERVAQIGKEWQGLTGEEIADLWDGHVVPVFGKNGINPIVFARAIEAKLREKNYE